MGKISYPKRETRLRCFECTFRFSDMHDTICTINTIFSPTEIKNKAKHSKKKSKQYTRCMMKPLGSWKHLNFLKISFTYVNICSTFHFCYLVILFDYKNLPCFPLIITDLIFTLLSMLPDSFSHLPYFMNLISVQISHIKCY